ncbi:hypothetical protein LguiB_008967 [Lonicera macranthoides]
MAEMDGASKVSAPPRPTINLPPRPSFENFFTGGLSPGPMTLVSNFFSSDYYYPDSDCRSFSQLLAGAMASPIASVKPPSFVPDDPGNNLEKEKSEKNLGFKQNRPMNLVVAHSPMFMIPPGLSPSGLLNSPGFFSPVQSPFGMSHQQALAHVTAQAALSQSYMHAQNDQLSLPASAGSLTQQTPSLTLGSTAPEQMHTLILDHESPVKEASSVSQSDNKPLPPSVAVDKPANDGYNWRKYGQKQVKTSEYPRSYYKCTHLNCPVKKKIERSHDGQVTEVIYKGQHNHELPQPSKHAKDGSDLSGTMNSHGKPQLGFQGKTEISRSVEADQVPTELTSVQLYESMDSEEMGDAELRPAEGDNDEPNPKRRNSEGGASELASSHKTITESRIVVQTRSEVDLLDDGYKWRKYGQKVVKGNPYPRSYYKCTYAGCNVRKHVERASADPKAVVTSYEGKHNHDVPLGRNCGHNTSNSNLGQLKPKKVVARKPTLHEDVEFGKDQLQVVLQLKEEHIIA